MEKELISITDSLFQEVKSCVEDCKSDVKNTVVPLSSAEAMMILSKQNQVLKELNDQILIYQKRADDLRKKIEQLQEKRRLNGENPDPAILQESESTRKNLQWLYCLRRILANTIGIDEMKTENGVVIVVFKNKQACERCFMHRAVLKIQVNDQDIVQDATISLPEGFYKYSDMQMSTAEDVIKSSIGSSCFKLTTDMLYFIYSQNRFYMEVETLKARYNVDTSNCGVLKVGFPNFVVITIAVPKDYPRVGVER